MATLRERKKEQRRQRIMDAAMELFQDQGFTATSMEQIAERAEVGVGTVYNYFQNKNALLLDMVQQEHARGMAPVNKVIASPPADPVNGVLKFMFAYQAMDRFGKPFLRELMAVIMAQMAELGPDMMQVDMELIMGIASLLTEYRKRGKLPAKLDIQEAAILIYSAAFMQFMIYISMDDMTLKDLKSVSARQLRLLFKGLLNA